MPSVRPLLILFLCIMATALFGQELSLESIFLQEEYQPRTAGNISFLHRQEGYVQLRSGAAGQSLVFFNREASPFDSIALYKLSTDDGVPLPRFSGVDVSDDDAYFVLKANEVKLYRRSGTANHYLLDHSGKLFRISGMTAFPQFSYDSRHLAYVLDNDLYVLDVQARTEQALTSDGEWNRIINGKSDWVYEEELELTRAFAWSPNGKRIAYLRFDESAVKDFEMTVYRGQTYPSAFTYKYPKVGEANAAVSLWIYDPVRKKPAAVDLAAYPFEYIPRICWNAAGTEVWALLLNRDQDTMRIVAVDVMSRRVRTVYTEISETYINLPLAFQMLPDGSFILTSERDGYRHLYRFGPTGTLIAQLSKGPYEVTAVYGLDTAQGFLYYQSNEGQTSGRRIFRVSYTTGMPEVIAADSGRNDAVFAPGMRWCIHTHSSSTTPPQVRILPLDGGAPVLMQDNSALRDRCNGLPKKSFLRIPADSADLEAWIIRPQPEEPGKRYPLLLYVYGGPGHQEVVDQWGGLRDMWFRYMATRGFAVACVDNRGSGGRGAAFERQVFLNLGRYETADLLTSARYFGQLPFIDSTRVNIYGASYGGYLSALCLLHGNGICHTGIAQSPVADWRFYDNIYTERYMRTPERNPDGYRQFNLLQDAEGLQGRLLLIHGMLDDNVHLQHMVEFLNALIAAHKSYDLYLYPDSKHGMSGGELSYDLYSRITRYLQADH